MGLSVTTRNNLHKANSTEKSIPDVQIPQKNDKEIRLTEQKLKEISDKKTEMMQTKLEKKKYEYSKIKELAYKRTYSQEEKLEYIKQQNPIKQKLSNIGKNVFAGAGAGVLLASALCPMSVVFSCVGLAAVGAFVYIKNDMDLQNKAKQISDSEINNYYTSAADRLKREIDVLNTLVNGNLHTAEA